MTIVREAFMFVIALVSNIAFAHQWTRYTKFCENELLKRYTKKTSCHPTNKLGLLLLCLSAVKHHYFFVRFILYMALSKVRVVLIVGNFVSKTFRKKRSEVRYKLT